MKPVIKIEGKPLDIPNLPQEARLEDLYGKIRIVSAAPTWTPKTFYEQFAIYINSTTYRFYWHDGSGWRYASGT